MAKDPVCGMDVAEKGCEHFIRYDHETIYFCSNQCKESFASSSRSKAKKKGFLAKFLEKLAKDNNQTFGGTPPSCH